MTKRELIEKLVSKVHQRITRIKGKEYSPTVKEIENEIRKHNGIQR